jgi:hypothetical protein
VFRSEKVKVDPKLPTLFTLPACMMVCTALLDDGYRRRAQPARLHTVCPHGARDRRVRGECAARSVLLGVAIG